jgi:hypothetical protein
MLWVICQVDKANKICENNRHYATVVRECPICKMFLCRNCYTGDIDSYGWPNWGVPCKSCKGSKV